MKNSSKNTLYKIREAVVIVYEITTLLVPLLLLNLAVNGIINVFAMGLGMFFYLLPLICHLRIFGDKPKQIADRIMGYE